MSEGPPNPWHSRGYLPHFDANEHPVAITYRLADALPLRVLAQWHEEWLHLPEEEQTLRRRKQIDAYLDGNHGSAWLRNPRIASIVEGTLLFFDGERYQLHAWVVMPNHVHVLITPRAGHCVGQLVWSWKVFAARRAQALLGRTGRFWQQEYFDRQIRDERHFRWAIEYIENNPVKARLCNDPAEWPFSSAKARRA